MLPRIGFHAFHNCEKFTLETFVEGIKPPKSDYFWNSCRGVVLPARIKTKYDTFDRSIALGLVRSLLSGEVCSTRIMNSGTLATRAVMVIR